MDIRRLFLVSLSGLAMAGCAGDADLDGDESSQTSDEYHVEFDLQTPSPNDESAAADQAPIDGATESAAEDGEVSAAAACRELPGACLWLYKNRNGYGAVAPSDVSDSDLKNTQRGENFNDKTSRVKNQYACSAWVLYDDKNYEDRRYCIKPGQEIDLHDSRWNFGDKISSIKRLATRSCSGYPTFE